MSGDNKKNNLTKILIGVIAVLVIAVIGLVVLLVSKNKDGETEVTTEAEAEATVTDATPDDAQTSGDAEIKQASCYVTVTNTSSWESAGGYSGQLDAKIINESADELKDWSIEIDAPDGTTIDSSWNGNFDLSDGVITITPVDYNGTITANGTVSDIGFIVSVTDKQALTDMTEGARLYIGGELYTAVSEEDDTEEVTEATTEEDSAGNSSKPESGTPYEVHGKLAVSGTDLVDENGDKFQLKGLSTHGISWFPDYINEDAFETFRDDWDANIIRLAMYTHESGGYCTDGDKEYLKGLIDTGVNAATDLGMYVIIDWHVLQETTPLTYEDEAKEFFEEISAKYKYYGNVIYEICNEPNSGTSWSDVKSYAEDIIPIIRANAPDAIIIVGTPTWCQDVDVVSEDPITGYDNIMYALHFYAATHTDSIRSKAQTAHDNGLPIIVSEFSICDASGSGAIDYDQAEAWFELIDEYNLSYVAWNISNKAETSSILSSSCTKTSGFTESDLSDAGKWIREQMIE